MPGRINFSGHSLYRQATPWPLNPGDSVMSATLSTPLTKVVYPCYPSRHFPRHCDEAWDEMFDAFIAYAKKEGLDVSRHERPMLFKDKTTKVVWNDWKEQWTAIRISFFEDQK
jgi:hypothetical protein